MAERVRYSESITIRCQPEITTLVDHSFKGSKPAEYVRQALLAGLRADGFDPASIPARDAGALYDSVEGKQRWAMVIDGQIRMPIKSSDRIEIRKAPVSLQMAKIRGSSYYGRLHRKLGWGGQTQSRRTD